jgi:hypothetical protein
MKNLLLLLGAVAMSVTFSMAESKCNGKAGAAVKSEKKCSTGKTTDDKKMDENSSSEKENNRTKAPEKEKESAKCGKGKCG